MVGAEYYTYLSEKVDILFDEYEKNKTEENKKNYEEALEQLERCFIEQRKVIKQ